jgi:hypothetical protein
MEDRWFRFYDNVVHDIKVQALPAPLFKQWVNVLCISSDNGGCLPPLNAVAFALRVDEAAAFSAIAALRKAGLLDPREDGSLAPHNWDGRQFITDEADGSGTPAAVRARKWRAKKALEKAALEQSQALANGSPNVQPNGSRTGSPNAPNALATVTASRPDTETETDTNTEKKEGTREVALVPSDWPTDHFDQFWAKYPNKVDRAGAAKSLAKAGKKGIEWSTIMAGLDRYIAKTDDRPWCNPTTWINQARWDEQRAEVTPHGKAKTGASLVDAIDADLAASIEEDRRAAMHEDTVLGLPPGSVH